MRLKSQIRNFLRATTLTTLTCPLFSAASVVTNAILTISLAAVMASREFPGENCGEKNRNVDSDVNCESSIWIYNRKCWGNISPLASRCERFTIPASVTRFWFLHLRRPEAPSEPFHTCASLGFSVTTATLAEALMRGEKQERLMMQNVRPGSYLEERELSVSEESNSTAIQEFHHPRNSLCKKAGI